MPWASNWIANITITAFTCVLIFLSSLVESSFLALIMLFGHESEWAPGVGDGQGSLACQDSWGRKELDTTEWLNWTELNWMLFLFLSLQHLGYCLLHTVLLIVARIAFTMYHKHNALDDRHLFPRFWRMEFRNEGVRRISSLWGLWGEDFFQVPLFGLKMAISIFTWLSPYMHVCLLISSVYEDISHSWPGLILTPHST